VRFLVDECTGPAVARWLRAQQHEVFSVYDEARGMRDEEVIKKAADENWILITNDKDFGEHVYRWQRSHHGGATSSRQRARRQQDSGSSSPSGIPR